MEVIFIVLLVALGTKFLFCGVAKLLWYNETISFATNLDYLPNKLGRIFGMILPLFELGIFLSLLLFNSLYTYMLTSAYFIFFIGLNLKAISDRKGVSCFCYGKLIKSRLGYGGLFNFISYLVASVICMLISDDSLIIVLRNICIDMIPAIFLAVIAIFAGILIGQLYGDRLSGRV